MELENAKKENGSKGKWGPEIADGCSQIKS